MKLSNEEIELQNNTLSSLKQLSDDIYYLDYYFDYNIDQMLSKGIRHSLEIYRCARKIIKGKKLIAKNVNNIACSTFSCHNEKNNAIFGRNFDYRTSPCLVLKTYPKNGYKSIGVVDMNFMFFGYKHKPNLVKPQRRILLAPYMVMDGMNENGLVISVLELNDKHTDQHNHKTPINTVIAIRAILDKCKDVDEALSLLNRYDMHSALGFNYHFHISDINTSVIVEYVNNKMNVIYPNNTPYQCLTNFYLSPNGNNKHTHGQDRYEIMDKYLRKHNGIISDIDAMKLLEKVKVKYKYTYKHILKYTVSTCYSAIYNQTNLNMKIKSNNEAFDFKL